MGDGSNLKFVYCRLVEMRNGTPLHIDVCDGMKNFSRKISLKVALLKTKCGTFEEIFLE